MPKLDMPFVTRKVKSGETIYIGDDVRLTILAPHMAKSVVLVQMPMGSNKVVFKKGDFWDKETEEKNKKAKNSLRASLLEEKITLRNKLDSQCEELDNKIKELEKELEFLDEQIEELEKVNEESD